MDYRGLKVRHINHCLDRSKLGMSKYEEELFDSLNRLIDDLEAINRHNRKLMEYTAWAILPGYDWQRDNVYSGN